MPVWKSTSRRWRGGRRDDSAQTRRKILISTGASRTPIFRAGSGTLSARSRVEIDATSSPRSHRLDGGVDDLTHCLIPRRHDLRGQGFEGRVQHGTRIEQLVLLQRHFILFALFASASRATSTSRRWRHAPRHRRDAPRSLGHDGEMNGDFYRVVQAGKDCPYLEYVDPDNCPDVSYDSMPRCEDPCLCEAAWKSNFGRPAPSTST